MNSVGTLKLRKPLLVNGEKVYEIPYDFEALTVEDITEADRYRFEDKGLPALYPNVDRATQLEIFARAVEKVTQEIGREDLTRLSAKDGMRAATLARDFFNAEDDEINEPPQPQGNLPGDEEYPRSYKYGVREFPAPRPEEAEGSVDGAETTSP